MLYVSILTSDRAFDNELWAVIWQAAASPTLRLLAAYNLAGNQRVFVWEGDSVADLQFMDAFNAVGELATFPAFDRTRGWQCAFAGDIEGFRENVIAQAIRHFDLSREEAERRVASAVDLRARALGAPNRDAALRVAREWRAEREARK